MYNVMIVDDEPLILRGMHSILEWNRYGLRIASEASSGEEAVERFLESPVDIVITDIRMPGISGLELIETIRSVDPNVKFIVLSGYEDFQYVKEGIRFGIENYLLKPIDVDELAATVEGTVRKLEQEGKRRIRSEEEKSILRNNLLIRWMNGTIPLTELKQRADVADIPLGHRSYAVAVGMLQPADTVGDNLTFEAREEMAAGLFGDVREMAPELLPNYRVLGFVDLEGDLVFLFSDPESRLEPSVLHRELEAIHRAVRERWHVDLRFSIGSTADGYADVSANYRKAKQLQSESLLNGGSFIVDGAQVVALKGNEPTYDRLEFSMLLAKRDRDGLRERIQESFERLKHREYASIGDAQSMAMDMLIEAGKQAGRNRIADSFAQLLRLRGIEQIRRYVYEYIGGTLEEMSRTEDSLSPVIRKVLLDIHARYGSELSLKTLGHSYNVHPVYLGQLFKKEMGAGFTDYVNGYRIRIAKELLLHSDKKANEIAIEVGCADPNYFYKLFAKFTGVSPTEFRSARRSAEG